MVFFPPVSPPRTYTLPSPHPYAPHAQPITLFSILSILGEEYKLFSSSLCNLLHSSVTSSLLGPNILLNTLFSNTLSFLSSRNISDQVSHPSMYIYIYIFIYLLIQLMTQHSWKSSFLLIPSKNVFFLNKKANVKLEQWCHKRRPRESNIFHVVHLASARSRNVTFSVLLLVTRKTVRFCFLSVRCL